MFKISYKPLLFLAAITLLSGCITPANDKLSRKLDQLSNGGDTDKVAAYLDKLDKTKITDTDGTLLRKTIDLGDTTILEKLLLQENLNINAKGLDAHTPLAYLVITPTKNNKAHQEMSKLLIDNGANVNATTQNNETILMLATENYLPETVKILIDNGADIDKKSDNGETALHKSKKETLAILVENGADITIVDNEGNTVLHKLYYTDDVKFLVEKGLDINSLNNKGETVLFNACNQRSCNNVKIEKLLAIGSNPNIQNTESVTVAHLALKTLSLETLKVLLANNADVTLADNTGKTPLHYLALSLKNLNYSETADIKQAYESAALLFAAGADPLAKDNDGLDPFSIAQDIINPMIIELKNPSSSNK